MDYRKNIYLVFISLIFSFSNNKIGYVHYIEGECYIKNNQTDDKYFKVFIGTDIYNNDYIKSNDNSNCIIRFNDDQTHLFIESNSIVVLDDDNLSREIDLVKGSLYIKNLFNENKRVYAFTSNNQIYIANNRLWVSSSKLANDYIFSLDDNLDVYNKNYQKIINVQKRNLLHIENKSYTYINNEDDIVPKYILNDSYDFNFNNKIIQLKKYDMIPIYGDRIRNMRIVEPYKVSFDFGTKILNNDSHVKVGIYPSYIYRNLSIKANIESFVSPSGNDLDNYWDDGFDLLDKLSINYSYYRNKNQMYFNFGPIEDVSFASGYMINRISNSIDYPRKINSGINLKYIFDTDFMDLDILIPSIRDFGNDGGVIAARTSLYISHNFPLTIGFGLVADINQFSSISESLNKNAKKRSVYGVEIDYNYNLISNLDLDVNIFGEFVGLWYPEYNYYVLFDGENVSNDLRWRKGTWGVSGPGVSVELENRYIFKFSFNYNSATFIPNYFNSTYLYNRARYYKGILDYPMIQKQIDYLNDNFLIGDSCAAGQECEYLIPKDVYPILVNNDGFSGFNTFGFTTEFKYKFQSYLSASLMMSVFIEDSDNSNSYYSFQSSVDIAEGYIRNLNSLKFYFSNIYFSELSDKYRSTYGIETEVKLPMSLSLIINLGQVYYDKNLLTNDIDKMTNSNISIKYSF